MLERMGVPLLAKDRTDADPIVFGGGPVLTANPEPYAAFFDVVLLGDGEEMLQNFTDKIMEARNQAGPAPRRAGVGRKGAIRADLRRLQLLTALASVAGAYIPQFYSPVYEHDTGKLVRVDVIDPAAPAAVQKQTYSGQTLAASTVVSPRMAWDSIYMAEVVRSCPEMCRFCMASYLTLPFRPAALQGSLIPTIERGLEVTDRIGLLGASVTQHPEFSELLTWLMQPERKHVRLSIASVRTNTVTPELAAALSARGTKSLTVAVESGSAHVRRIVNKKLDQEEILAAAKAAAEGGLEGLKLYGMVGVPGEEEEDVSATIAMMVDLRRAAPCLKLTLGCSTFVPKSHTPFQYYGVRPQAEDRLKRLEKALSKEGIAFRPESYKWSVVQAVLSRGDRRLSDLLLVARGLGDSLGAWRKAFKDMQGQLPQLEHYAFQDYEPGACLPWSHLRGPLPEATLVKHLEEAQRHMARRPEAV